jgi:aquaporin Z
MFMMGGPLAMPVRGGHPSGLTLLEFAISLRQTLPRQSNREGQMHGMTQKGAAEFLGTFWLVLGGCGSAVLAAAFPDVGIGLLGVALAFGLTVVTMAYAIGHISGCHLNPAAFVLYLIASGKAGYELAPNGLAVNGVAEQSPGGYSMAAGVVTEVVMTAFFLLIIMGSTHSRAPAGFAPLAIGLGLTLIHLISIPVTNTSVNPARSTGPALIVGGLALQQLWIFWVAPIVGGIIGGGLYRHLLEGEVRPAVTGDAA